MFDMNGPNSPINNDEGRHVLGGCKPLVTARHDESYNTLQEDSPCQTSFRADPVAQERAAE